MTDTGPDNGGSSSWGWNSSNGREFVVVAQSDDASFSEISREGKLIYLGRLPQYTTAKPSLGARSVATRTILSSDQRLDPKNPVIFSNEKDLTGHFNGLTVGRIYNVVVNEERDYAVAVGAQPRNSSCRAGLIFIDLKDPTKPTSPGCASGDDYVHDAYDVTSKSDNTTKIISRISYEGASYTHQGWLTDVNWQTRLVLDDEYDEYDKSGEGIPGYPITYFWDITSLETPKLTDSFHNEFAKRIDHNQFVIDGLVYQSNYSDGLRILDIRSLNRDPSGAGIKEVAYFDIYPEDDNVDGGGVIDFVGS